MKIIVNFFKKRKKVIGVVIKNSDDESEEEEEEVDEGNIKLSPDSFGYQLKPLWRLRFSQLKSDYAISGWLLSIKPNVFNDAQNYTQSDENVLRRVANKL